MADETSERQRFSSEFQDGVATFRFERPDILNIAGFSDQVFAVISAFISGQLEADHWTGRIEAVAL